MQRGEIWRATDGDEGTVVLLDGDEATELRALLVVEPATDAEKDGFVLMSGADAADPATVRRIVATAGSDIRAIGIEIPIDDHGVVRLALPRDDHIFCTWLVTLSPEHLAERLGALTTEQLGQLGNALRLSGLE